jgi:hypothetical protein
MIAIGLLIFLKPEVGKGQCPTKGSEEEINDPMDFSTYVSSNTNVIKSDIFFQNNNPNTITYYTFSNLNLEIIPDVGMYIEKNVKVKFINCTFTAHCSLSIADNGFTFIKRKQLWDGFFVDGEPSTSNHNGAGCLELENCTVEYSHVGVSLGQTPNANTSVQNGGILLASGTNFNNNRNSIIFKEYLFENSSVIDNCNFYANDVFDEYPIPQQPNGRKSIETFISLYNVYGLEITGCHFFHDNNTPAYPGLGFIPGGYHFLYFDIVTNPNSIRGIGILSENSSYNLDKTGPCTYTNTTNNQMTIQCYECEGRGNYFEGLQYGIKNLDDLTFSHSLSRKKYITNTTFKNNLIAVREEKTDGTILSKCSVINDIDLYNKVVVNMNASDGRMYGFEFVDCTDYKIVENYIDCYYDFLGISTAFFKFTALKLESCKRNPTGVVSNNHLGVVAKLIPATYCDGFQFAGFESVNNNHVKLTCNEFKVYPSSDNNNCAGNRYHDIIVREGDITKNETSVSAPSFFNTADPSFPWNNKYTDYDYYFGLNGIEKDDIYSQFSNFHIEELSTNWPNNTPRVFLFNSNKFLNSNFIASYMKFHLGLPVYNEFEWEYPAPITTIDDWYMIQSNGETQTQFTLFDAVPQCEYLSENCTEIVQVNSQKLELGLNIKENFNNDWSLFPNPNNGKIFLKNEKNNSSNNPIFLSLISSDGKVIISETQYLNSLNTISLDYNVSPGLYKLVIIESDKLSSLNFIVK